MNTAEIIAILREPIMPHVEMLVRLTGAEPFVASLTGAPRWEERGRHMLRFNVQALSNLEPAVARHIHGMAWTCSQESESVVVLTPFEAAASNPLGIAVLNTLGDESRDDCCGHGRLLLHRLEHCEEPVSG
jgi:hypothetical protein